MNQLPEDRAWSTRTLAVAAVVALIIGAGGGAALGSVSGGADSRGGPGGGNVSRMNIGPPASVGR